MVAKVNRQQLGFFPTPLYKLDNLSAELGVNLWIKRDDFTGINLFGGNKTRKLEFLMGKAKDEGAEYVITYGATQSNHAMQTVWAACKNNLKPILYLVAVVPPDENDYKANLLLDCIYGAEVHILDIMEGESFEEAERRSFKLGRAHAEELNARGTKCYEVPMGGANDYGSLGYLNAMIELAEQMESAKPQPPQFKYLYHATGSGGTAAGIMAGNKLLGLGLEVHSISSMDVGDENKYAAGAAGLANGALALIGAQEAATVAPEDFIIDQNHYGEGYEIPSDEATAAIKLLAQKEGILVDPVYSGKAFAGMLSDIRTGKIPAGSDVLFLHTGGATVFFAEKEILGELF